MTRWFEYNEHFKGITKSGKKFIYCPIGDIVSWHPEDYNHEWCHWCKKFFNEVEK